MDPISYAVISALGNTANSLWGTQALRTKALSEGSVALLSLLPAFLISLIWSFQFWGSLQLSIAVLMVLKNILYAISFYLRFRGLSNLGGFQGALLAASQPILVSALSLVVLKENLFAHQWFAVLLIGVALLLPVKLESGKTRDVLKFALFPALLSSLVVVIDRWILVNSLSPLPFFVLDKVILLPVVAATLVFAGRYKLAWIHKDEFDWQLIFWTVTLGMTWVVASYTYAISLAGEKTAIVTLIRNLAFPAAALGSLVFFKEQLSRLRLLSLTLVVVACFIASQV